MSTHANTILPPVTPRLPTTSASSAATPPPTDRPTTTWPRSYTVPPTDGVQESMGTPPPTDRPTTTWPRSYTVPPTDLAQESMATPPPTDRPTTTWPRSYTVPPTELAQEPMATPNTSEKTKNITYDIPGPTQFAPAATVTAKNPILPTPTSDRPTSTYTDRKGWVYTTLSAVSETPTSTPGKPMPVEDREQSSGPIPTPATNRSVSISTNNQLVDHSSQATPAAMAVDMRSGTSNDPIVIDSPESSVAPQHTNPPTVDMRSGTSTDPIVIDSPQSTVATQHNANPVLDMLSALITDPTIIDPLPSTPPGTSYTAEYTSRPHYGPHATPTEIRTCETRPGVTSSSSMMETLMPSSTVATVTSFATPAARDGEVGVAQTPGMGGMGAMMDPAVVLGGLMFWKVFGGKKG